MNMLSALAPTSRPVDPFNLAGAVPPDIAMSAAVKTVQVERAMGQDLVALLDPSIGRHVDRRA